MRLVIEGLPVALRPVWLILGVSTVLYAMSVLPVRRWSFFCAMAITWVMLSPFYHTRMEPDAVEGAMLISYAVFLSGLVSYSYLQIRKAKLHNFYLSKVLLEQAYIDALTDIPNRRSFMAQADRQLRMASSGQYLAMIDIDNFKRVNDLFGHDVGDEVLKRVALHIKRAWPVMHLPDWAVKSSRSSCKGWTSRVPSSRWRRCANGCARTRASIR